MEQVVKTVTFTINDKYYTAICNRENSSQSREACKHAKRDVYAVRNRDSYFFFLRNVEEFIAV